jgi:hypothetical protein
MAQTGQSDAIHSPEAWANLSKASGVGTATIQRIEKSAGSYNRLCFDGNADSSSIKKRTRAVEWCQADEEEKAIT